MGKYLLTVLFVVILVALGILRAEQTNGLEGPCAPMSIVTDRDGREIACMTDADCPAPKPKTEILCMIPCWYSLGDEPIVCREPDSSEQVCTDVPEKHEECGQGMCMFIFTDAKE